MDDIHSFPLLAIVGQTELKVALVLGLINPYIGGVLLSGPYGVGKTTAVRGLLDILPTVEYEDLDREGNPHTYSAPMRLVELPLNARIEDVVGGINERVALEQQRVLLQGGILEKAHKSILYVDEINLLDPQLVNILLDAAAQGRTLVRRGVATRLFASQFVLIGSMNPEEGKLRPQIFDRFGLRVWVTPLEEQEQRLELYRRTRLFRADPAAFRDQYAEQTAALAEEVVAAREILPHVVLPPEIEEAALELVHTLRIPSHRAEIALLEGARARAAADFRGKVIAEDLYALAPLTLRQRRSQAFDSFAAVVNEESEAITAALAEFLPPPPTASPQEPEPSSPSSESSSSSLSSSSKKRQSMVREIEQNQEH